MSESPSLPSPPIIASTTDSAASDAKLHTRAASLPSWQPSLNYVVRSRSVMAEAPTRFVRPPSVSSAGTASTSGALSFVPRYTPKPDPAYISASSAADHVTHRQYHDNYDLLSPRATPINDGAAVAPGALALLNSFLDSLLYNFLQKSRSTNLAKLRVAILEVLKTKLGREAVASADEELEGLVGELDSDDGADIDDSTSDLKEPPRRPSTPSIDWHLESAFKRMRLRVMVFIRLGDFDDEDEEKFLNDDAPKVSTTLDQSILSSPAAVYLASVLEYLAEQTLSLAGDAAYSRSKSKTRRPIREDSAVQDFDDERVVVDEVDVEKIALNPTLGRLWRTWRKHHRSITSPASPAPGNSRRSSLASPTRSAEEVLRRQSARRSGSSLLMPTLDAAEEEPHENIPDCEPSETDIAANISLPMSERDVDEIEIPGLATVIYDEYEERFDDDDDEYVKGLVQPRARSTSFSMPGKFEDELPKARDGKSQRPVVNRQRSNSLPYLGIMPWDWIPASVRRALARLSEMDDAEVAAITPLPEDEDGDFSDSELEKSAAAEAPINEELHDNEPLEESDRDAENQVAASAKDAQQTKERHGKENGLIAGAALAGVAAAAGVAVAANKDKAQSASERSVEPSSDATRAAADFVPKSILKAPSTTVPTMTTPETDIEHGDPSKSAVSVYEPTTADADGASSGSPIKARKPSQDAGSEVLTNGVSRSTARVPMPASLGRKVSFKDESADDEAQGEPRLGVDEGKPSGVDSKLSSPMDAAVMTHASEHTQTASDDVQVKPSLAQVPEGEPISARTIAPQTGDVKQTATAQGQSVAAMQQNPANPYSMLYDDVEPEAIGVAKTSNVPIHTPTPPMSSESRPWTPVRVARSASQSQTNAFTDVKAIAESKPRNAPSPLRAAKDSPEGQRAGAIAGGDYDLDKPIDPGRYQNWNRPKESPTIPKFYNQPVPVSADGQRPGSISQSAVDHSPKGSQASGKSSNKRASEELKEREFDALLDRKETVKYTLTPEEIRDVGPYSPKKTTERKASVPAPIDTARNASLPAAMSPTLLRKTPGAQTTNGVQASSSALQQQLQPQAQAQVKVQPPVVQQAPSQLRPLKISEIRKSISALSPEPIEPRRRRSGLMAREPRVLGGETKDFVDFIRSCTPNSDDQVRPAALANRWSAGPATGSTRSARSNMVPREPDTRSAASGDLIEFIRSGPQGSGNSPKVTNPNTNKPLPSNPKAAVTAAPPQITRKTRRNKDPYAIDTDEEDDDFTALPSPKKHAAGRSENLQDFLRSTSPGPGHLNGISNAKSTSPAVGQRSASATGHRNERNNLASAPAPGLSANNSVSFGKPAESVGGTFFSRKKHEARPAGAVGSFGGDGFHYSTNDLADYLRSSGPSSALVNGNAMNGIGSATDHTRSQSANVANSNGRITPSGSIGMKRGDSTRRRLFGRKQVEI